MSLEDDLRASGDIAFAFAAALERSLGDDALLTVGMTRDTIADVLTDADVRAATVHFSGEDGTEGTMAFVALRHFAEVVERTASDEIFLTAISLPFDAAVQALSSFAPTDLESDGAEETDLARINETIGGGAVVYPILEGTDPVACLAISVRSSASSARAASPAAGAAEMRAAPMVLADVEMGVTAELGRTRMTVRDLLSLTPGAVIDLDRAAGAPVDVLVNGTLIARGEVVVIEEEFGIRISEILQNGSAR